MNDQRLDVRKTHKLCIGDSFVQASRKDLRDTARSLTTAEWFSAKAEDPFWILDTEEFKTAGHSIGV